ncbi:isoleucine--tRNA ligase [Vermiphilus pyriformis]|nr:MAG: isoleucine--tRNA ligase [Vermiphilus pyriformis]
MTILYFDLGDSFVAEERSHNNPSPYKNTLNLPRTDFPIRAQASVDDPAMIERWKTEQLYTASAQLHTDKPSFVLHDGPPYANGHIHIGHAYNKILKDIVGKSQRMLGKHVRIIPGWDCHGLPIEFKVTQEHKNLSPIDLKRACRLYAQGWVATQKEEFERLGILMNWSHPYLTMDYNYQASIMRAFGIFVSGGYIERKNKTVPWCPHCQTVLASAEIEYQDRKDPSIYVTFKLTDDTARALGIPNDKPLHVVIWTTTPWTLPLNRAVLYSPRATYVVLDTPQGYCIVSQSSAEQIAALTNVSASPVATINPGQLSEFAIRAHHPLIPDMMVPLIPEENVSLQDGTAFVHCAPGCGPEDYDVGVKHKLDIYSPIASDGTYTSAIVPEQLTGMKVSDGQIWVIKELAQKGALLIKTTIKHSYPHCWRCHNPLIFRATKQWFCDLSRNNLKERTINAIEAITTIPHASKNRLLATVEGRLEWCLSRQRVWGVPIPALVCKACDDVFITHEFIEYIAGQVQTQGTEFWDQVTLEDLKDIPGKCSCGASEWVKEKDILDVWFDSGVSHYAVLLHERPSQFPANLYLEGKDQHRGWFQSSLLTSMVINDRPPMNTIMTHGFTVDENGRKMSKSLGNVVSPAQIIEKLGTDGLRLWVSSIDYADDAVVSEALLKNVQEVFRKIRNTARFLLSNLYDYSHSTDAVPLQSLYFIDWSALVTLFELQKNVINHYKEFNFTAIFHALGSYCSSDLSSFYLDIVKDRLYVEKFDSHARRSAQTTCWYILDTLTRLIAPILSFTAEQISDYYQISKPSSIHLQEFADLSFIQQALDNKGAAHVNKVFSATWYFKSLEFMRQVRSALLKVIEGMRQTGEIKHSLEASIRIYYSPDAPDWQLWDDIAQAVALRGQTLESFMKEVLIVSHVVIDTRQLPDLTSTEMNGLFAYVHRAQGTKCPRCWQWHTTSRHDGLDLRCARIVESLV